MSGVGLPASWAVNSECHVVTGQHPVPTTSLPFVHTARRYLRWTAQPGPRSGRRVGAPCSVNRSCRDVARTALPREGKSRNKVTVGEPSVGSRPKRKKRTSGEGAPLSLWFVCFACSVLSGRESARRAPVRGGSRAGRVTIFFFSCPVAGRVESQPLAVDHSARASMKSAASRTESCELQLPHRTSTS